jgi:hypothetical protein
MFLNEEFLKLWEELSQLNEAKADTEKLIAFAGEDLANRFLAVKNRLKAPKNDLYYWIKYKTTDELEQAVASIENTKSNTKTKKEIADNGAELVYESEHWKIYHITTFEASKKYGRDSKWCITGAGAENGYQDTYWKDYTNRGITFYFLITKGEYNARGTDSKFAVAVYPDNTYEAFNQQDTGLPLENIPYYDEINFNKFNSLTYNGREGEGLHLVIGETTSYKITIDNSTKTASNSNIGYDQALNEILAFISSLTPEEKQNIDLYWKYDGEADAILMIDPPSYYITELEYSEEDFYDENLNDPINRLIEVASDSETINRLTAALSN